MMYAQYLDVTIFYLGFNSYSGGIVGSSYIMVYAFEVCDDV